MLKHLKSLTIAMSIIMSLSAPVTAQTCPCKTIPYEGEYLGATEPGTITYENGDADNCPTQLRLQVPLRRAGDREVNVVLTCDAAADKWTGSEPSPLGGNFNYELSAVKATPPMGSGGYAPQLAQAVDMTGEANLTIFLPPMLLALGKAHRTVTIRVAGGEAAPCMCSIVKTELAHVQEMKALYSDPDLISYAQKNNLNGSSTTEKYWMEDSGKLHATGPQKQYSFDDIVMNTYNGIYVTGPATNVGATVAGTASTGQNSASQNAQKAARRNFGGLQQNAYAETDVKLCEINMISAADVAKSCDPAIMIEAAYEHEGMHVAQCNMRNVPPVYTIPDGTKVNWKTDLDTFGSYNGRTYPRSGYTAWSQNPSNQSKDEAAAYSKEEVILKNWLAAKCP